jgi:hypothetical protein
MIVRIATGGPKSNENEDETQEKKKMSTLRAMDVPVRVMIVSERVWSTIEIAPWELVMVVDKFAGITATDRALFHLQQDYWIMVSPALRALARAAYRDLLRASAATFSGKIAPYALYPPCNTLPGDEAVLKGYRISLQAWALSLNILSSSQPSAKK